MAARIGQTDKNGKLSMNKLFIAAALASSALAGTARADSAGPYITFEGGAVMHERTDINSAQGFEHSDRFKTGWEAGGAFGYDFGHYRLEAEGFYNRASLREHYRPNGTPLPNGDFTSSNGLAGHTDTYAAMGNMLFGLGHWGGIKTFAGGGIGYARTHLVEVVPATGLLADHAQGFAWQALAGFTLPIGRMVDLGFKYRYFRPDGADKFVFADGTSRQGSLRSHSLLATLTFNFGTPAEPVVEAAAPPPPPPP